MSAAARSVLVFGIYLGQVRIYTEADYERIQSQPGIVGKLVLGGSWLYKRQVAEMDFAIG